MHEAPLMMLTEMSALVKTVQNDYWSTILRRLQAGPFSTPTTLPPPAGLGMTLYSSVSKATCGLVWDSKQLDLTSAYVFPSGYYAKTEFNVDAKGELIQPFTRFSHGPEST